MDDNPVYFIANFTIVDHEKYNIYGVKTRETLGPLMKNGEVKLIVFASGDTLGTLEGTPNNKIVILEFKNRQIAENWYRSSEYQSLIHMRKEATTDGWVALTDRFVAPTSN